MVDAAGNPIAWLYDQRRFEVPSEKISNNMKLAIVSIEDRRFPDHKGVDWQGTLRAFLTNTTTGEVQQGASTLDQQYVKNYQLLVVAKTDAERRAAIETTPARKIREIRMALTLDKELTKDEILTRYLNLVPFGNGSFGIQDAAQTYFGVDAADLTVPQSAMLAYMVQSSSALNPYTNVEGVTERRNTVLDTMITNIPDRADEFRAAKEEPLGVLETPNNLPRGCIAAGDRGFFCDYALKYLSDAGITRDQINEGGYLIKTTLDPQVQASTKAGLNANASANLDGIANVMNVIRPGQDSHKVIAMASSRTYGLNADADETVQAQPYSLAGDGAGSVFKIFTTAAAMEKGLGINATLDVPKRFEAKGMGSGGAAGCPVSTYCVENAGELSADAVRDRRPGTVPKHRFRQAHRGDRRHADRRHGCPSRHALVRRSQHLGLRRAQHGRLPEGTEPRFVHPRPHLDQPARTLQRRGHSRLARQVVPAESHRFGLRPLRQARGRHRAGL